ncbi:MAG: Na+/H+ antiporter NhaC family protein [Clostridiaceae bacterium]|nr:Na+/H+ antiporter NhaC family protein [Clostridiaceae bacterium]MBW4860060.1 Na+/H+ antiporter NhaC family protein [Clostridiaceae bacterium]MBW4867150.1 Na+/H+ antiporter NhaC family protein [Clostridiaceae bacterium]
MALLRLSPVFLMAGLMIGGMNALVAAPIATIYAAVIARFTEKISFGEILDCSVENVKEMELVFFILMMAYAMAECFMATGVGAAIINMALRLGLTGKTVAVTGLIVTSILSVATGTSWGTFAACAPIFLWLNHIVDGNLILTTAAVAGGACFGDNIGLISDTTVVSSGIQKVEVIDRIKHQGAWALLCLVLSIAVFFVVSVGMGLPNTTANASEAIDQIPGEVWDSLKVKNPSAVTLLNQVKEGVPYYMIIPLILVIIVAVKGLPTLACLGLGIVSSMILGLIAGTVPSIFGKGGFLELIYSGFSDAGSWVIVMMMWVGAFGGIMTRMDAFAPLSNFIASRVENVRQLMTCNALLCLLGNAALSDEMAQIVTIGPIIKTLTDDNVEASEEDMYKLRLRNAAFGSSLGVFGSQLIPWHVYVNFYIGIASAVYPLHSFKATDIIKYNFMGMIAVVSMIVLTRTGWDRFIPSFSIPSEPDVKIKKQESSSEESVLKPCITEER